MEGQIKKYNLRAYKPVVLIILDGWGLSPAWGGNAIILKKPENINRYWREYPHKVLDAFNMLAGDTRVVGDSRLGHSTIAAGRRVKQDIEIISKAISDRTFYKNKVLKSAFEHAKEHNSNVHLIGLLSKGGVHAEISHLVALIEMAYRENFKRLYLDLFSDGVDSGSYDALGFIELIEKKIKQTGIGKISSISGRLYAMDRNRDYSKQLKVYQAIVEGKSNANLSPRQALASSYREGYNDFNLPPALIQNEEGKTIISDNDAVIFFNFRPERMTQLVEFFLNPNFRIRFWRPKIPQNLFIVSMTDYWSNFKMPVAFGKVKVSESLAEVLDKYQKRQLHLAEKEKEAHVTTFFNCQEEAFQFEERKIVSSLNVSDWTKHPEMSATKITNETIAALKRNRYDFILINFANVDILAHTGNISATAKAVNLLDREVDKIVKQALSSGGAVIITADHGNAEEIVKMSPNQISEPKHTNNPVPFILITPDNKRNLLQGALTVSSNTLAKILTTKEDLTDIAPTILEIMGLPKPEAMTGHSLLNILE